MSKFHHFDKTIKIIFVQTTNKAGLSKDVRVNTKERQQLMRLVTGFPPRRSRFKPGSGHVRFEVGKVAMGKAFPESFSSLANVHSTSSSIHISDCHPGMVE
jgi:hypothetical protein